MWLNSLNNSIPKNNKEDWGYLKLCWYPVLFIITVTYSSLCLTIPNWWFSKLLLLETLEALSTNRMKFFLFKFLKFPMNKFFLDVCFLWYVHHCCPQKQKNLRDYQSPLNRNCRCLLGTFGQWEHKSVLSFVKAASYPNCWTMSPSPKLYISNIISNIISHLVPHSKRQNWEIQDLAIWI